KAAATLWFEFNLAMLFLSVWLLTDGWLGLWKLVAFPLSLFFLPVLGALSVGQYDFPVLLGTSLLIYSLRREHVTLTVLGMLLLTFKPHVGALILLAATGWLIYNKKDFRRRLPQPMLIAITLLFLTGFLADPAWIVSYPGMLLSYQGEGNVSACSECASLPVFLSRWFFDGSLTNAAWIAIVLLVLLILTFYLIRSFLRTPEFLLSAALLTTLLISPYLYNYDFLLLLVPFAVFAPQGTLVEKAILLLCYLVPTFALLLYGREGNISLILVSMVMLLLFYARMKNSVIDFTRHAA
ncbi:MAG TPA: glycosyltransferase 87 family protein, partial [Anaerolineales bacterium]|nr:glycosyltransferase 87 family protein [Anaerolineales bacterium]